MAHVTLWRCRAPPHGTVEVLQSSPSLLSYITRGGGCSDGAAAAAAACPQQVATSHRRLFLLFTGNPGMVQFYLEFVHTLSTQHSMDVLVMGFAGHSLPDHNNGRLFTLQEQIDIADQLMHAVLDSSVVNQYAGNIYVGGHSIGGFVALHMLARHKDSIKLCFGLCPVLTHIMASPNGQGMFFWGVPVLQWIAALVGSLFAFLPQALRRLVVNWHGPTLAPKTQKAIAQLMTQKALMNVFFLTFDEFRCVTEPDRFLLRSVQEKLCLYYVPTDGWAPPEYAEEIRKTCPRLKSFIMEEDASVPHAWCLQHTQTIINRAIAKFVAEERVQPMSHE